MFKGICNNCPIKNILPGKKADFRIYLIEEVAYLLPLNWRACQVCHSFDEEYKDYKPLRMTPYMIEKITEGLKEGNFEIKMEKISA